MTTQRFAINFSGLLLGFVTTTLLSAPAAQAATTGEAFVVTQNQIFRPEIVNFAPELAGRAVEIATDSVITVLGEQTDVRGDLLVHLGIDSDDLQIPSELWIRATDLDLALNAASLEKINDDSLEIMINKKMTYCFRYVKQYLLKKKLVSRYLPGASAWMAKDSLPREGFRRTGQGPSAARVNDVCVYTGGNGNNGHIEVMTPSGWYYGYGFNRAPIGLNNHRLISCYTKR
jgi:hypothetical protein